MEKEIVNVTTTDIIASIKPNNIWEIGVGPPELCRAHAFIPTHLPIKLIEPFRPNYNRLVEAYGKYLNVDIFNIALGDEDKEVDFNMCGECSWVEGVESPSVFFGKPAGIHTEKVQCLKLSHFDHGQIDVALIDAEGSEWKILSQMVSRPRLIALEIRMENLGRKYMTPDSDKIQKWLNDNKYHLLFSGVDMWFVKI